MSFDLGFAPEFFLAEGEPYDRSDACVDRKGRPASVWSAIEHMREHHPEKWGEMAQDVFQCEPKYLTPETALDKIRETDTCGTLTVPVDVWVDEKGDYKVYVWDDTAED